MIDERDFLEDQLRYILARMEAHHVSTTIGTVWAYHRNRVVAALNRLNCLKRYDHRAVRQDCRERRTDPRTGELLHHGRSFNNYCMSRAQEQYALSFIMTVHGREPDESQHDFEERTWSIAESMIARKRRAQEVQRYQREVHPPNYDEEDDTEYSSDVPF